MTRPTAGALSAAVAGLLVAAAAIWGQFRALDDDPPPATRDILLAGVFHAGGGQASHLFVRSLLTGNGVTLEDDATFIAAPTWSPDGERLAWIEVGRQAPDATIVIWERASDARRRVPAPTEALRGLEWSPDSQFLAIAGEPLRVIDTAGRVVATGPEDGRNAFDIQAPVKGWSPDSSRYALIADGTIVHFEREFSRISPTLPSQFGLTDLANGYAAAGWNADGTLTLFAAETTSFDLDFDTRTSSQSDRSTDDFAAAAWRTEALGELVIRVTGFVSSQTFRDTADGRGGIVIIEHPQNRSRVFVDDGATLREFEYLATDPSRNVSVVLTGNW